MQFNRNDDTLNLMLLSPHVSHLLVILLITTWIIISTSCVSHCSIHISDDEDDDNDDDNDADNDGGNDGDEEEDMPIQEIGVVAVADNG